MFKEQIQDGGDAVVSAVRNLPMFGGPFRCTSRILPAVPPGSERQTALGAAVFRRSEEAVRLLLDHRADPHAGERSAADVAAFFALDDMVALLRREP